MGSNAETEQPLDKRRREMRPTHITVGSTIFERNDLTAARFGVCARTLNAGDKEGAPFAYFGGTKYRPLPDFDAHVLSGIRRRPHRTRNTEAA
jgi:hypothetical protein